MRGLEERPTLSHHAIYIELPSFECTSIETENYKYATPVGFDRWEYTSTRTCIAMNQPIGMIRVGIDNRRGLDITFIIMRFTTALTGAFLKVTKEEQSLFLSLSLSICLFHSALFCSIPFCSAPFQHGGGSSDFHTYRHTHIYIYV